MYVLPDDETEENNSLQDVGTKNQQLFISGVKLCICLPGTYWDLTSSLMVRWKSISL
jgi:hypothetical protein